MSYGKMLTIRRKNGRDGGYEKDRRYRDGERNAYDGGMYDYDRWRYRDGRFAPKGRGHRTRAEYEGGIGDSPNDGRSDPMRDEFYADRPVYGFGPYNYVDDRRRMEYPGVTYNHYDRERDDDNRRRKEHGYAMSDEGGEDYRRHLWMAKERMPRHMTRDIAEEWTEHMKNADGTKGPHWSMEQIKQLREQKKELQEFDLPDVYAVMNMMYSDYCEAAKKFNVNNIDFYVCMTKAWLDDEDAGAGEAKTLMYYECVAR